MRNNILQDKYLSTLKSFTYYEGAGNIEMNILRSCTSSSMGDSISRTRTKVKTCVAMEIYFVRTSFDKHAIEKEKRKTTRLDTNSLERGSLFFCHCRRCHWTHKCQNILEWNERGNEKTLQKESM